MCRAGSVLGDWPSYTGYLRSGARPAIRLTTCLAFKYPDLYCSKRVAILKKVLQYCITTFKFENRDFDDDERQNRIILFEILDRKLIILPLMMYPKARCPACNTVNDISGV